MISDFIAERVGFDLIIFKPQTLDSMFGACRTVWLCLLVVSIAFWLQRKSPSRHHRLKVMGTLGVLHLSCTTTLLATAAVGIHCCTVGA